MIDVLIAAETGLYREGLAQMLAHAHHIRVIGTAADSRECVAQAQKLAPLVVLLELAMPESLNAVRSLGVAVPKARVLALGDPEAGLSIAAYAEAGVAGYVPQEASPEELLRAVQSAARTDSVI